MNLDGVVVRWVKHGSEDYWNSVELRRRVLRLPLGLDFSAEELERESSQLHGVVKEGDEVIGVLVLVEQGHQQMKMRQVAVSPENQGKGIGQAMVRASEPFALEQGFKEMHLHARETAVPFYLNLGYEVYDEPFEEVGLPHRKMRKQLKSEA